MPAQVGHALPAVETTYKAREVEGIVDLYLYRPIGYRVARVSAKFNATPTQLSVLGACFGVVAGHLYFYSDLRINLIGMGLHVLSNLFDNADGQLARLTNQKSRIGRSIDGLADHVVFASIYLHLTLRYLWNGAPPAICLLALAAVVSHAWQSSAADYFRNSYLFFVTGRARAEADSSAALQLEYAHFSWRREWWPKLLLGLYINYTRQQEMISPKLRRLRDTAAEQFTQTIPHWLQTSYRHAAQPALFWWGFAMTNTRMFFLFLFLLIRQPVWYFWFEVSVLNILVGVLLVRQERMSCSLLKPARAQASEI